MLFPYWYAIKPATPFTKMYSVFRCSNFNAIGGDKRVRTADLLNAIQALYQLSYTPKRLNYFSTREKVCQLFAAGFEKYPIYCKAAQMCCKYLKIVVILFMSKNSEKG